VAINTVGFELSKISTNPMRDFYGFIEGILAVTEKEGYNF